MKVDPKGIDPKLTPYSLHGDMFSGNVLVMLGNKLIRTGTDMEHAIRLRNQLHVGELIASMKLFSAYLDDRVRYSAMDAAKPKLMKIRTAVDRAILNYNRQMDHPEILRHLEEILMPEILTLSNPGQLIAAMRDAMLAKMENLLELNGVTL